MITTKFPYPQLQTNRKSEALATEISKTAKVQSKTCFFFCTKSLATPDVKYKYNILMYILPQFKQKRQFNKYPLIERVHNSHYPEKKMFHNLCMQILATVVCVYATIICQ